ncbi:hypothetical protein Neosp_014088 [[Neocosmospora] mangrovei]
MVNRGKPSLGCFTCKDSRVKVQARVDKQRRRRDLNNVSHPQPPIGSPFTVCNVFKLYDDYFLNSGMGIFEALPVLGSGKHAPCFSHALNAAALASGAGQLHQSGALIRARQAYGDAILMLRRSMQDLTVGGDDSVLATLFVLGFFEADPASLRAEFEGPWIAWPGFYPIDPIVQTSVDLLAEIESTVGSNRPKAHIINVANQVRCVLGSLDLVVSRVSPDTSSPASFNGLLRNDSTTSAAIAKSLYLTVRLHLVDALLRSFGAQIHVTEADDDLLSQVPEWLVVEQEAGLRTLWEEITATLVLSGQATEAKNVPGTASRMFCLSWPMAAISQSTMASEQWKGRVWELIDKDSGQ